MTLDDADRPAPGVRLERLDGGEVQPGFPGMGNDRRRQRMLTRRFQRGHQPEQGGIVQIGGRLRAHHVRHPWPSLGDGARLVEDDRGDVTGALQRLAALDQDAERGAAPGGHHDGGRDGQPHGAGTGDDQHRDRRGQPAHEGRGVGQEKPRHEGDHRELQHDRHEHPGDPVGQALDRGARALGVAHQGHDARQDTVRAQGGGAEAEGAGAVDGAADDTITHGLLHRQRLAGEHRLVHRAAPVHHLTVHRNPFTRADQDDLAPAHRLHRQVHFLTIALDPGGLRLEIHQRPQRHGGLPLGARLEGVAGQDEGDDDDHRFVVHVRQEPATREDLRRHGGHDRVEERRAGANRHQGVHVGGMVTEGGPGAGVEVPAGPRHDKEGGHQERPAQDRRRDGVEPGECAPQRRGQALHDPAHEGIGHRAMARMNIRHHQWHGDDHRHRADQGGHHRLAPERLELSLLRLVPGLLLLEGGLAGNGEGGLIAGLADRRDEGVRRHGLRVVGHCCLAEHQVHRGPGHSRLAGQGLLHPAGAGRTGHPLHGDGDRACRGGLRHLSSSHPRGAAWPARPGRNTS